MSSVSSSAAATYPTGFEERTVASGLTAPTAVAWAPDGRMFIAEKGGRVKVVTAGGTLLSTPLLDISGHVYGIADRGLLGIAVDAGFATNHYLYLLYVYNPPGATGVGRTSRLTRVTVNGDNTASGETTILGTVGTPPCPAPSNNSDCIPADGDSHAIGTVRSAADGTLWVGTGDAASWSKVDPVALRTYDEQSLAGKIIHVDRNGNGLSGHPFCPADATLTHVCTKLYAKGFRNPFRFTLRPGGGLAVGDVGWETQEEVDLVASGRSYGWPCYEGPARTNGYRDLPGCAAQYATEGTGQAAIAPVFSYLHSSYPNYQAAVVGGPTYTGGPYPDSYDGEIFFGDYVNGFIKLLRPGSAGQPATVSDFATGAYHVDLEIGPTSELYYVSFGDGSAGTGSVRRVVYTPGNRTPLAVGQATPAFTAGSSLQVSFSGAGSSDPDGDVLSYQWSFGDGSGTSAQRDPVHTYSAKGEYYATLTVTDSNGAKATDTVRVSVGNTPPSVQIASPANGSSFMIGDSVALQGSASDLQEGPIAGSSLEWHMVLIHNAHVHDGANLTGARPSFATASDHDADSHYRITLSATDSTGLTGQQTVEIYPRSIGLTLASSPPGAPMTYGGFALSAPQTRPAAIGFEASISAADIFERDGRTYQFTGWSDGGARAHDVTIPAASLTLTASYRQIAGPPPGAAGSLDRRRPVVSFRGVRGSGRTTRLEGTARDAGGVARVRVALRARDGSGRCRWWSRVPARLTEERTSCRAPRWMAARLQRTGKEHWAWRLRLGAPVPPGSYTVMVKAFDPAGNSSRTVAASMRR
jgi:glucose/arabinose dehydrogenase